MKFHLCFSFCLQRFYTVPLIQLCWFGCLQKARNECYYLFIGAIFNVYILIFFFCRNVLEGISFRLVNILYVWP